MKQRTIEPNCTNININIKPQHLGNKGFFQIVQDIQSHLENYGGWINSRHIFRELS